MVPFAAAECYLLSRHLRRSVLLHREFELQVLDDQTETSGRWRSNERNLLFWLRATHSNRLQRCFAQLYGQYRSASLRRRGYHYWIEILRWYSVQFVVRWFSWRSLSWEYQFFGKCWNYFVFELKPSKIYYRQCLLETAVPLCSLSCQTYSTCYSKLNL